MRPDISSQGFKQALMDINLAYYGDEHVKISYLAPKGSDVRVRTHQALVAVGNWIRKALSAHWKHRIENHKLTSLVSLVGPISVASLSLVAKFPFGVL